MQYMLYRIDVSLATLNVINVSAYSTAMNMPRKRAAAHTAQGLTGFNKIAIQGAPQMAVEKEASSLLILF